MTIASIPKDSFLKFLDDFWTCRKSIMDKIMEYNDPFLESLHRLIRSITHFESLEERSIRNIALKLKRKTVLKNSVILNLRELSSKTYFIASGIVCISVFDPKTGNRFPFQYLKAGSSFNFINCLLNQESLFQIHAVTYCVLYVLEETELNSAACNDHVLKDLIEHLKAKYYVGGEKYDYCYVNQNLPPKRPDYRKRSSVNIKIGKLGSASEMDATPNAVVFNDKKEETQINSAHTLLGTTKINSTATQLNRRTSTLYRAKLKHRRMFRAVLRYRFELIMKLKDAKVLFGYIDRNFQLRAKRSVCGVVKEIHLLQYNIQVRTEIFELQETDVLRDADSLTSSEDSDSESSSDEIMSDDLAVERSQEKFLSMVNRREPVKSLFNTKLSRISRKLSPSERGSRDPSPKERTSREFSPRAANNSLSVDSVRNISRVSKAKSKFGKSGKNIEIGEIVNMIVKHQLNRRQSVINTLKDKCQLTMGALKERSRSLLVYPHFPLNQITKDQVALTNKSLKISMGSVDVSKITEVVDKNKKLTDMIEKATGVYLNKLKSATEWLKAT